MIKRIQNYDSNKDAFVLSIPWNKIGGISKTGHIGITSVFYDHKNETKGIVGNTLEDDPSTWFTWTLANDFVKKKDFRETRSTIEWNRGTYNEFLKFSGVVGNDGLKRDLNKLTYPRVKKIKNNDLLMFFQEGQVSWEIFYMRSSDGGRTWGNPKVLVAKQQVKAKSGTDYRCFATADAIQLENGWILVAYSYRTHFGYYTDNWNNGIEVRISKDDGYSWSDPIVAYMGANWEPAFLQLPDGEVQLYYTQRGPYNAPGRVPVEVGMVRSYDNGLTWEPKVDGPPWRGIRLSQYSDGDGMPVANYLKDDKGIVFVCENLTAPHPGPWVVWSSVENNWNYPDFSLEDDGPWDRRWLLNENFRGYAPYIVCMSTGETIVSANGEFKDNPSEFLVFIGNEEGKNFSNPYFPFPLSSNGWWGSLEVKDLDTLIAVCNVNCDDDKRKILYTEGHFIRDGYVSKIENELSVGTFDNESTMLFMGSESNSNCYIKSAYNECGLYLFIELKVNEKNPSVSVEDNYSFIFYIDSNNAKNNYIGEGIYKINTSFKNVEIMKPGANGKFGS